jgi:hypothetical protein
MINQDLPPEFMEVAARWYALSNNGTDPESPAARAVWEELIATAPPAFYDLHHQFLIDNGLLPLRPDGYSPDGKPVYRLEDVAALYGLSPDDAKAEIDDEAALLGRDLFYTGDVLYAH